MNKSELRTGMAVETKEGEKYFVFCPNVLMNSNIFSHVDMDSYNEDLTHKSFKDLNIIKVYETNINHRWELIWQRSNKVEVMMSFNLQPLSLTVHNCKAILDDKKTTVILPDGTQASTVCLPEDIYSNTLGMQIAFDKAMIKWFSKQLKCLNK